MDGITVQLKQEFQNILKQVSDSAKVDDYEKFIKGQKVVTCILTIVNSKRFSSSRQNPRGHWLVLKPLLEFIPWHFINSAIPIYSILLDGDQGEAL